jgi:hypothetical protein
MTTRFTIDDAIEASRVIGVDLETEAFDATAVRTGMKIELEHRTRTPELDITGDDPVPTAKIALAHLRRLPDYGERLDRMEAIGDAAWAVAGDPDLGIVGPDTGGTATVKRCER